MIPTSELERLLADDVPYGDLTTEALGIGARRGTIRFAARNPMVVAAIEQAAALLALAEVDARLHARSGDAVAAGALLLVGEGAAAGLLRAWKVAQTLVEIWSGVATATRAVVTAARRRRHQGRRGGAASAGLVGAAPNRLEAPLSEIALTGSMNYISRHMEEKYGIPWCEYNFFGPSKIAESLRKIASYFDDKIKEGAERVIAKYQPLMDAVIAKYRPRLEGKTVMLFVGGLRPRHVIGAYEDVGMEVVGTGYEFGHNDDYQRTAQHYVKDGTLIYDDVTGYEFEKFVEKIQPDLVGSGIKEKYVFQKMGVPFRQMHSWDYSGPYHGYDGFAIFARDMDMAINAPVWKMAKAPWKMEQKPALKAAA